MKTFDFPISNRARKFHSQVWCSICGKTWLWGLSWDGSMDGKFVCPEHNIPVKNEDESGQVKINGKLKCPECKTLYDEEPRVEAGMKCQKCAYSPYDK